ncbi:hypothetical protein [Embleya sp. NPDC020630]|uniref:hypothetical protein n=1 Tax=Embleya sp. NPDC020630 TaxID=3363979 RepID=UPI0037ACA5DD
MSDRLTAVRVVDTGDPEQPLQVRMNRDRLDGRDYDMTLVQLSQPHADIGARPAQYPAPVLPARDAR